MPYRIVAAAIKHKGLVFTGARHCEIIHYLVDPLGYDKPIPNHEQGFIDADGKFWTRIQAMAIAQDTGQIPIEFNGVLTSEDLW